MRTLWLTYRWIVPAAVAVVVVAAIVVAVVVLRAGKPRPDWCAIKERIDFETTSHVLAVNPPADANRAAMDDPTNRHSAPATDALLPALVTVGRLSWLSLFLESTC